MSVTSLRNGAPKSLQAQAKTFFDHLRRQMDDKGIFLPPHWSIDHICYRVSSCQAYKEMKVIFSQYGQLLIESEVGGRPISTFKLLNSLYFLDRKIDLVELPAPKKGKTVKEGFEHIEVVCDQPFSEIMNRFKDAEFDERGLRKDFNAELELKLDGLAIKFHHLSLESVVTLEGNSKVFSALKESKILRQCERFSPLVAGTFPLGISTPNSDLDILLYHHDVREVLTFLRNIYSAYDSYESHAVNKGDTNYGIIRFRIRGVPFEIYIENTETIRQRAYLHFQVEERLLKLGGEKLRKELFELRQKGMKTEPAFCSALGLQGDPYLKLIELHSWSENRLLNLIR